MNTRPKTAWEAKPVVRLDADDYALLEAMRLPGEDDCNVLRRALRLASTPAPVVLSEATIVVRYRRAPHFPDWLTLPALAPADADERIRALRLRGWEVTHETVAPGPCRVAVEEEDEPEEDVRLEPALAFYDNDKGIRREPRVAG